MARNWHYLRGSKHAGWPKKQTALSLLLGESAFGQPGEMRSKSTLLAWGAATWTGEEGEIRSEHTASGTTLGEWWLYLDVIMRRGERLWIWADGMAHALAVLGFWRLLDCGAWRLVGADRRCDAERTETGRSKAAGLCIVADPPTLILAAPCRSNGTVCFADQRNLGGGGFGRDNGGASYAGGMDAKESGAASERRRCALERARRSQRELTCWQRTVAELNLGGLRATSAAQAWHGWRYGYLTSPVQVHCEPDRLAAERDATYGGRCEVYRCGLYSGTVVEHDAAAHYPAIAEAEPLPARIVRGIDPAAWCLDRASACGVLAIARGRVKTDAPCLPHRHGGRTVYPVGTWIGTYCLPEIELLRREGGTFQAERVWYYEGSDCLAGYMRRLWAYRVRMERGGPGPSGCGSKLLANALIGRIGATERAWEELPQAFFPARWAHWYAAQPGEGEVQRYRAIAGRVEVERVSGWGDESIPAISAYVYALGRVRLWAWLKAAGPDETLYCDTDSVWTTRAGADRIEAAGLLRPGQLGGLRVKSQHPWMRVYGIRHYETPAGMKWAGVPRNCVSGSEDGWAYTYSEAPGESARHWREPDGRLVTVSVPDRRGHVGGRLAVGGEVYPLEVLDHG